MLRMIVTKMSAISGLVIGTIALVLSIVAMSSQLKVEYVAANGETVVLKESIGALYNDIHEMASGSGVTSPAVVGAAGVGTFGAFITSILSVAIIAMSSIGTYKSFIKYDESYVVSSTIAFMIIVAVVMSIVSIVYALNVTDVDGLNEQGYKFQ